MREKEKERNTNNYFLADGKKRNVLFLGLLRQRRELNYVLQIVIVPADWQTVSRRRHFSALRIFELLQTLVYRLLFYRI